MKLLNYERILNSMDCKDTTNVIKIVMYTKENDNYKTISTVPHTVEISYLNNIYASSELGTTYLYNDSILICIGELVNDINIMRTNVKMAIPSVIKLIKSGSQVIFEESEYIEDAIYSFVISSYKYDFLSSDKKPFNVKLVTMEDHSKIIKIATMQNFARFLGDTPANLMTPALFTEYANKLFGDDPVNITIFDEKELSEMKMLLSVSAGSANEGKLMEIKYFGRENNDKIDVALVGKGVTFDSGGISLKPALNMAEMKMDMMGAATLLATLKLAVQLKLKLNIAAAFPLVENIPGSRATKPGDVFVSLSGKTVEVDNTDAEGRLILGDAITYIQKYNPKYLIDAATLTGAMVISLGSVYGGYFTNDEDMGKLIYEAGIETNDLLWRLPLSQFYRKDLKSNVADIINTGGREAGSIKAAEFIHEFVNKDVKWAHFDIAGLMSNSFNKPMFGKNATGRPIPAFIRILEKLSKQQFDIYLL